MVLRVAVRQVRHELALGRDLYPSPPSANPTLDLLLRELQLSQPARLVVRVLHQTRHAQGVENGGACHHLRGMVHANERAHATMKREREPYQKWRNNRTSSEGFRGSGCSALGTYNLSTSSVFRSRVKRKEGDNLEKPGRAWERNCEECQHRD